MFYEKRVQKEVNRVSNHASKSSMTSTRNEMCRQKLRVGSLPHCAPPLLHSAVPDVANGYRRYFTAIDVIFHLTSVIVGDRENGRRSRRGKGVAVSLDYQQVVPRIWSSTQDWVDNPTNFVYFE